MFIFININHIFSFRIFLKFIFKLFQFKWGLGIGDWGLGIGDWAQSPIPNPQSPIPNPQTPFENINLMNY